MGGPANALNIMYATHQHPAKLAVTQHWDYRF
jgi:hypothetical protein